MESDGIKSYIYACSTIKYIFKFAKSAIKCMNICPKIILDGLVTDMKFQVPGLT
jgi:hypothetical protein